MTRPASQQASLMKVRFAIAFFFYYYYSFYPVLVFFFFLFFLFCVPSSPPLGVDFWLFFITPIVSLISNFTPPSPGLFDVHCRRLLLSRFQLVRLHPSDDRLGRDLLRRWRLRGMRGGGASFGLHLGRKKKNWKYPYKSDVDGFSQIQPYFISGGEGLFLLYSPIRWTGLKALLLHHHPQPRRSASPDTTVPMRNWTTMVGLGYICFGLWFVENFDILPVFFEPKWSSNGWAWLSFYYCYYYNVLFVTLLMVC